MNYNSYIFVLLFLPLCLLFYFILNNYNLNKVSKIVLICFSLWFYAYKEIENLIFIIFLIFVNYIFYLLINKYQSKILTFLGIIINIIFLFFSKYFEFIVESFDIKTLDFVINNSRQFLGVSFITFSNISFLVDTYRKEIDNIHFMDFVLYETFFPKIIQGPIVFFNELINQFNDENKFKINSINLASGLFCFICGLSKKVLIADIFGKVIATNFLIDIESYGSLDTIIYITCFMIQIYFDFSGYSDMSVGISRMFNIDIINNFNSPYKAISISDFWKRWHISLTRFLTKYIYIPLGGNRKGEVKTYVNIFIVFIISGIWHGPNWNYLIWGAINGIAIIINKIIDKKGIKLPKHFAWLITMIFILFSWTIFFTKSINEFIMIINNLLSFKNIFTLNQEIYNCFYLREIAMLEKILFGNNYIGPKHFMLAYYVAALVIIFVCKNINEILNRGKISTIYSIMYAIVFAWSILSLGNISVFIYQGF